MQTTETTPQPTEEELKMKHLQDTFNQLSHQRGVLEFQTEEINKQLDDIKLKQYNANIDYQKLFDKWQKTKLELAKTQKTTEVTQ